MTPSLQTGDVLFSLSVYVLVYLVVAFVQGAAIGGVMRGIPVANNQYAGGSFSWPLLCICAIVGVALSPRMRRDALPFALTVIFFAAAYLTLGQMMWSYMIPYSLTVADAAAPQASLQFFFYGGVIALPVIALYTMAVYWVFRGKIDR